MVQLYACVLRVVNLKKKKLFHMQQGAEMYVSGTLGYGNTKVFFSNCFSHFKSLGLPLTTHSLAMPHIHRY